MSFLLLCDSGVAMPESFLSLWVVIDHVGNFTIAHPHVLVCCLQLKMWIFLRP